MHLTQRVAVKYEPADHRLAPMHVSPQERKIFGCDNPQQKNTYPRANCFLSAVSPSTISLMLYGPTAAAGLALVLVVGDGLRPDSLVVMVLFFLEACKAYQLKPASDRL